MVALKKTTVSETKHSVSQTNGMGTNGARRYACAPSTSGGVFIVGFPPTILPHPEKYKKIWPQTIPRTGRVNPETNTNKTPEGKGGGNKEGMTGKNRY